MLKVARMKGRKSRNRECLRRKIDRLSGLAQLLEVASVPSYGSGSARWNLHNIYVEKAD